MTAATYDISVLELASTGTAFHVDVQAPMLLPQHTATDRARQVGFPPVVKGLPEIAMQQEDEATKMASYYKYDSRM
jgi:hypothetical protein